MQQVIAQYNHARWVAICPQCLAEGVMAAAEVKPGEIFICPEEHPEVLAMTYVPNPRVAGAFNPIPDEPLRAAARLTALEAGHGYEVIFPAEKVQIESVLRLRPPAARNWMSGTTLEELKAENAERGL